MSYILYTDKNTNFECKVELQGASLKNADVRLVVEAEDLMLMFKGNILKNGRCVIPISKMNKFMDETTVGEMRLEVIAENTYFQPWQSSFIIDSARKLTVEVATPFPIQDESIATVKFVNDPINKFSVQIIRELRSKGITINNIKRKRTTVMRCINEHVKRSGGFSTTDTSAIINAVVKNMANGNK